MRVYRRTRGYCENYRHNQKTKEMNRLLNSRDEEINIHEHVIPSGPFVWRVPRASIQRELPSVPAPSAPLLPPPSALVSFYENINMSRTVAPPLRKRMFDSDNIALASRLTIDATPAYKLRKKRRKRDEVERKYACPCHCSRSYGSEGALKTHIKIKHQEDPIYKSMLSTNFVWPQEVILRDTISA
ncbi:Zinc finger, C2H2 type family protein [Planoprotostelium fungivorum]|uniref:Zinc finger, C2H2 type family protein n=1 Tax=Planoprotostelium fungivorum TaxID=1890364 RepID=A0A2P6NWX4_9EUKA|nr:Zinc finger, C2H2 type family protein [Planoprotostelium fungivorum]